MSNQNSDLFGSLDLNTIGEEESGDVIQLISTDEEAMMSEADIPEEIPILPIRNTVLFPGVVLPITVGRQKSIRLVKKPLL